jgi:hypothetical protein
MRNLSDEQVAGYYAQLMEHVKWRMLAIHQIITDIVNNPNHPGGLLNFELCALQIRKVCETLALAVLVAHQQISEATTNRFRDKWNADAILGMLAKINENSFPMKVIRKDPVTEGAQHHLEIIEDAVLTQQQLQRIYTRCGDFLHIGSLDSLLKEKRPTFRSSELIEWNNLLTDLLQTHIIALPEFKKILFCAMVDQATGKAHVAISHALPIDGDGPPSTIRRWRASREKP